MTLVRGIKKILWAAAACALVMLGASAVSAADGVAADNIYIENICVGGMNAEAIQQTIDSKMAEYSASVITINVGDSSVDVTAGELGLYQTNTDIASEILTVGSVGNIWRRYEINKSLNSGEQVVFSIETGASEDAVRSVVSEKCAALNVERADMTLAMGDDGMVHPTAKQDGISVDVEETVSAICDYIQNGWYGGYGEINAVVSVDEAEGDEAYFAVVDDIIGSGTTSFASSSSSRAKNIQVASSRINGTVLMPGEEFSAISKMIPFTAETGYEPAPSYEMGEVVETYGGGACQVSTTLYRAVLEAELEVTQRSAHSMSVSYVDPSMDAAVAEGSKDFKFVNSTDYPIYIEAYTYDGTLTFNIYGCETRDAGRTLDFYGETTETLEVETVYDLDSSLPVGYYKETSGHAGSEAHAVKIVYQDGVEVSREEINHSTYNHTDHTITIGTNGATDEQLAALETAAANNDFSAASAAVGSLQAYGG